MLAERTESEWLELTESPLAVGAAHDWVVRPGCGAVVLFSGTVRDHAIEDDGRRDGVQYLEYEAYAEETIPRLRAIVDETRRRWPTVGRVALIHRMGRLEVGESSVLCVVSAPHRPEAFAAARFAIDALKSSAPIWKHETWSGGSAWGTGATAPIDPREVPTKVDHDEMSSSPGGAAV